MAIKIKSKTHEIPIEIDDLNFTFIATDENMKLFYENRDIIVNDLKMIQKDMENHGEDESYDALKKALEKGFDLMLDEGAFIKIYERNPASLVLIDVLSQLAQQLGEEINALSIDDKRIKRSKK